MRIETEDGSKLSFFQTLLNEAKSYADEISAKMKQSLEQYKGDNKIDDSDVAAKQVRNITYELVESQVTSYIPNPKVSPKQYSTKNEKNAKSIETLLRNKRDELPFEKMNDMDERFNPIYGGSVWLVEWDNSIVTHNTVGDVKISCLSPMHFIGQPNIYDVQEMEYCFIKFETTKEDITRKYGVTFDVAETAESDEGDDDKTATLYVCYYKDDEDRVCQYIWSGDTELSDITDYYARKRYICRKCGKKKELCSCEKPQFELQNEEYEELDHDVILSDGSVIPSMSTVIKDGQPVMEMQKVQAIEADGTPALEVVDGVSAPLMIDVQVPKTEPTKLPFYTPKRFPITIRKNTSEEDNLWGQSDCEFIRPQQQAINKVESRIMEKLMGGGVYPLVPDDFTEELDNSIFKKVFKCKPNQVNQFGRIDLQVDISRDIAEADRIYDHAKRILGITDSYQGQYDSSAQSGKAKQIQVQQAAGRLDSKRQMKNAAYAEIDQIVFQYYLAYADEPRPVSFKDADGRMQNVQFNRYDFIERDEAGEYYQNDEYLFSADASADIERSREMVWEMNSQDLNRGAFGDPASPQTLLYYWQAQEKAHYPGAADNVERFRSAVQEQMAQLQQQNAALQGEVQKRAEYENYLIKKMGENRNGNSEQGNV